MTDSYGYGIEWFLFTKIASQERLASLLEMSIDQFRKILKDLPMSDAEIAQELGINQTKVMNIWEQSENVWKGVVEPSSTKVLPIL